MNWKDNFGIKRILESYLIAFALMNVCQKETTDVFTVVFFGVAFYLIGNKKKGTDRRDMLLSAFLACVFTLFYVAGTWQTLTGGLTNRMFLLFYFACTIGGLVCLFYEIVLFVLVHSSMPVFFEEPKKFPKKAFGISVDILFLSMVPMFLINYPAVMTPDSLSQFRQAVGIQLYSDHHPWMHTLLIELFYKIGFAVTGNVYAGIACYTIVQMFLVAVSVSYVWMTLYEMGLKKKYCVTGIFLFVLCPYNMIYGVTMWKDILFSMAVFVLTVTLLRLYKRIEDEVPVRNAFRDWMLYGISGFFVCMLRHNGFYAFIASVFVLCVILRRHLRIFLPVSVGVILICFLIKGPVMDAAGVAPGQFVNNLCIPLQQIARVVAEGKELTQEEWELLEKINDVSYLEQNYAPGGADPAKAWVEYGNAGYLDEHKADYLKLWIDVGIRYPGTYVQAFIDQTKGYWYPMAPEQTVYFGITENADGLTTQAILRGPAVIKICELLTKLYTIFPIFGILYSMGAMFWGLLLCMAVVIRNGRWKELGACFPVFFITGTLLLATPLVADLRYNYPLMVVIPCIMVVSFGKNMIEWR